MELVKKGLKVLGISAVFGVFYVGLIMLCNWFFSKLAELVY